MSLPEPVLVALPLLCLLVGSVFTAREIFLARKEVRVDTRGSARTGKRCRYCKLGYARLTDEAIRCEGDSLVQVRTFACANCGLPQWSINRIPSHESVG